MAAGEIEKITINLGLATIAADVGPEPAADGTSRPGLIPLTFHRRGDEK